MLQVVVVWCGGNGGAFGSGDVVWCWCGGVAVVLVSNCWLDG